MQLNTSLFYAAMCNSAMAKVNAQKNISEGWGNLIYTMTNEACTIWQKGKCEKWVVSVASIVPKARTNSQTHVCNAESELNIVLRSS